MDSPLVVALVAIATSLFAVGLLFVVHNNLQSDMRNLSDNLVEQSQTIQSLGSQLTQNTQLIKAQNSIIGDLKNQQTSSQTQINNLLTNVTNLGNQTNSLENRISGLESRISTLEQKLNQQSTHFKTVHFPGVLKFYNAADGSDDRVVKKFAIPLPADNWIADFDYKFTASSAPTHWVFVLTTTPLNLEFLPPSERIGVVHGVGDDQLFISASADSHPISIYPNINYFVRLERTPAQLTLSIFSDAERNMQVVGSPASILLKPTDYPNLNYLQHSTLLIGGSGRTLTAEIDKTLISLRGADGGKQTFFEDDYSSSAGWTQIGSTVAVNGSFVEQIPPVNGIIGR